MLQELYLEISVNMAYKDDEDDVWWQVKQTLTSQDICTPLYKWNTGHLPLPLLVPMKM
jgi:hypothetical protein